MDGYYGYHRYKRWRDQTPFQRALTVVSLVVALGVCAFVYAGLKDDEAKRNPYRSSQPAGTGTVLPTSRIEAERDAAVEEHGKRWKLQAIRVDDHVVHFAEPLLPDIEDTVRLRDFDPAAPARIMQALERKGEVSGDEYITMELAPGTEGPEWTIEVDSGDSTRRFTADKAAEVVAPA
jgi:hypothetical protein